MIGSQAEHVETMGDLEGLAHDVHVRNPRRVSMPWGIRKKGGQYEVYKRDDGKSVGTHATYGKARDQQQALYASEREQKEKAKAKKDR